MANRTEQAKQYRAMLPQRVKVSIERAEDGLWATISTDDGKLSHCYTQAANATELVPMVNDAIQTYFEIPDDFKSEVGYYTPLSEGHLRLEEMFRQLVNVEQEASATGGKRDYSYAER